MRKIKGPQNQVLESNSNGDVLHMVRYCGKTVYKVSEVFPDCVVIRYDKQLTYIYYGGYMRSSRVYEPIYTIKNLYNDCIILQDVGKYVFLHFTYFQVTIIGLSSPLGASLYTIGTRFCSQRSTSFSSKCRETVRWRRLFINKGYEGKQKVNNRKFVWNLTEI